jgi:hypothetical protein
MQVWKACPKCGDIGVDFINGRNETDGMVCRIGCGFKWAADDPRWLPSGFLRRQQLPKINLVSTVARFGRRSLRQTGRL